MNIQKPMRILQVVGAMRVGGIETWLVQVLRRLNRNRFQVDVLTHTEEECFYDQEVRAMGARILPCLHPSRPWAYARNFLRILKENGPYEVVHSHVFRFSGLIMRLAAAAGVPLRIAHSRDTSENRRLTLFRRAYNALMTRWLNRHATQLLAVSLDAALALFGPHSLSDSRLEILPSGVDLSPFKIDYPKDKIKSSFGLSPGEKIVGHVGRFEEQKNHFFFLEVGRSLINKGEDIKFLLVGDGPLRPQVEAKVLELGFSDRVIFTGIRDDVPRILKGAADLLLFPSKWEGTPRVIVEAQAAGVPCLISDVIPSDVDLVKPLVRRLSLAEPPEVWATVAWELLQNPPPVSQAEALRIVAESPFHIENNVRELEKLYLTAWKQVQK